MKTQTISIHKISSSVTCIISTNTRSIEPDFALPGEGMLLELKQSALSRIEF